MHTALSTLITSTILVVLTSACGVSQPGDAAGDDGADTGTGTDTGSGSGSGSCDRVISDVTFVRGIVSNLLGTDPNTETSFRGSPPYTHAELDIRLYSGTKDFPKSPQASPTGSIDLSTEGDISDCGMCISYSAPNTAISGNPLEYYFAVSGKVDVQKIDTDLALVLTNVKLAHVVMNANGAMARATDGCTYNLAYGDIRTPYSNDGGHMDPRTLY